jgi:membrane-anchored mycosin MYCP
VSRRVGSIAIVVSALAVPVLAAVPPAAAVRPPAVDDSLLPRAASPAPPEPTAKQAECIATTFDPHVNPSGTQLSGIDLPALWALSTGKGQKVAVIDTGVAPHPQIPRLTPGGDYVAVGDGTEDCDGHGTLVAGIIAATPVPNADPDFAGLAPGVSLITIRQSSDRYGPVRGRASGVGNVDTMAMAVRTAADLGATVINISSVACDVSSAIHDRALGAALAYAVDVKDVVVVAAAGNVGRNHQCPQQNPSPPSSHPNEPDWENANIVASPGWYDDYVLTVGSVGIDGNASAFTFAGPWVDVAAPGEAVVSLDPASVGIVNTRRSNAGAPLMGTSYAAPVVSGLAALVRARFPELSARQVMQRIEATAHRPPGGWNSFVGNGAVDPLAALTDVPVVHAVIAPSATQQPVAPPTQAPAGESAGRRTALSGVAGCGVMLVAAMALAGPARRLGGHRRRDSIMGNQRGRPAEFRPVGQELHE